MFDELPADWAAAIQSHSFDHRDLERLVSELDSTFRGPQPASANRLVTPNRDLVFRAFHLTPLEEVRVVILGQDPYPQAHPDPSPARDGVADGLAFSSAGLWPQSSLVPLLWELRRSGLQTNAPCGADLGAWARRGVLLLNAWLVYASDGLPAGLRGVSRDFTRAVLASCIALTEPPAFLVLGDRAWGVAKPVLKGLPPSQVIRTGHPSRPPWPDGTGAQQPFVQLNDFLGPRLVDWNLS